MRNSELALDINRINADYAEVSGMDFEFYRNFIVTAEAGNITTAAKRLNMAQTAISAQISKLEEHYNVKLFNKQKGKRRIELTEAGVDFLVKARTICSLEEDLEQEMRSYSKKIAGHLRFGVSHVRGVDFINEYLADFAVQYSDITYNYYAMTVDLQLQNIQKGNLDFGFANSELPATDNIASILAAQEKFYVVYKAGEVYPWREKAYITPKDIAGLPLCIPHPHYELLSRACKPYHFKPDVKVMTNSVKNALEFARHGVGVACFAAAATDVLPEGLERRLIKDDSLVFQQSLFWSKQHKLSAAAKLFLEYFREKYV